MLAARRAVVPVSAGSAGSEGEEQAAQASSAMKTGVARERGMAERAVWRVGAGLFPQ